jgi:hypothetical protein
MRFGRALRPDLDLGAFNLRQGAIVGLSAVALVVDRSSR